MRLQEYSIPGQVKTEQVDQTLALHELQSMGLLRLLYSLGLTSFLVRRIQMLCFSLQMRRLLGHVTIASEHLTMLMLQHAYLAAPQQLSKQTPTASPAERGERLMSAVITLGELSDASLLPTPSTFQC